MPALVGGWEKATDGGWLFLGSVDSIRDRRVEMGEDTYFYCRVGDETGRREKGEGLQTSYLVFWQAWPMA